MTCGDVPAAPAADKAGVSLLTRRLVILKERPRSGSPGPSTTTYNDVYDDAGGGAASSPLMIRLERLTRPINIPFRAFASSSCIS